MLVTIMRTRLCWIALAAGLLGAETALGQMYGTGATPVMPRRGNQNVQARAALETPTPFERSFTIQDVGALGLKVMLDNGSEGVIAPDKTCKIDVTGTAEPAFLKSGLLVKFNAQLDKKGRATAPVNELEIVTLQTANDKQKDGDSEKGSAKKAAASASGSGAVLGHVTEYKNNELTVQTTDGQQVKAELGANPAIKVHVSEFRGFAQSGDKVDVKGYFVPAQPGKAMAREMKITLSSPLGSDPSKKKSQAKSTSTASK
jgi:hypothetical protein